MSSPDVYSASLSCDLLNLWADMPMQACPSMQIGAGGCKTDSEGDVLRDRQAHQVLLLQLGPPLLRPIETETPLAPL